MPEVYFDVRWPDASRCRCYSPSSTVTTYFERGHSYPLDVFLERVRAALNHASDRVRRKYGFACGTAAEQLDAIERAASRFADQPEALVTIERFEP